MSWSRRVAEVASAAALLALAIPPAAIAQPAAPLLGFSPQDAAAERALEARFDASLSPADQKAWMERMASQPNQVGSPHDRDNAEWTAAQLRSWGWDTRIETFYVLYPTPVTIGLELLGPNPYRARLHEPAVPGDPTSADQPGVLPPYLAYQGDGDVTAPLVYVNFGMPADYEALARQGVDVRGKIVIARYGGGWRGLKPKLAQEHGAVGCIIYSDPHEDGYYTNDVWPKGPQRPPGGVQRGSVQDITLQSGDPLTPGIAATRDAPRLRRETAPAILKIPALPISYADAEPFLAALGGPLADPKFRGALPITYHTGPGPVLVHLTVRSDWSLKPIYDVCGTMRGSTYPDQWVVRGNHHDGWVFGAEDPLSGNVALLDEAKAIGGLAATGWRPKRTLIYCSWDGEEPGLLGSTEWAEAHAADLRAKAVLYVNSDNIDRGFVNVGGSHELQHFANEVMESVTDPETGVSVGRRLRAHEVVRGYETQGEARGEEGEDVQLEAKAAASGGDLLLEALGSGSDYTPFLQHLGVPSIDLGYGGEGVSGGVYHSAYDTFTHYERFGDPGFRYGVALSETAGRLMLRMADADTPPVQFKGFADTIATYVDQLHKLADHSRERSAARDRLLDNGDFRLAADPTKVELPPERQDVVPPIDLSPLDRALVHVKAAAGRFDAAYAAAAARGLPPAEASALNSALQGIDQALSPEGGLPRRPWYRNLMYAPGVLTGYGAKTLPAVREAIEDRRWDEANRYAGITAAALEAYADRLDRAAVALGRPL